MWPDQKVSDQGLGRRNKLTCSVAVISPFKVVPLRHHTIVPMVLPLFTALLEMTLWNSSQLHHCVSFYLLHVLKPIPLQ